MKVAKDSPVYEAIRTQHNVEAVPRLIAEWNMNRYIDCVIDNRPKEFDEAFEPEYFPIESIVKTNRPDRGVVKARIGESRAGFDFSNARVQQFRRKRTGPGIWENIPRINKDGDFVYKTYTRPLDSPRYYVASPEDEYKYWTSPRESNSDGAMAGGYEFPLNASGVLQGVDILIEYDSKVRSNKFSICAETTWSAPQRWDLYVGDDNGSGGYNWRYVANQTVRAFDANNAGGAAAGDDGRLEFYYDGSSWGGTENRSTARNLETVVDEFDAVRFRVWAMTKPNAHANIIEVSPRLEKNLTPYLTSVSDDFEMTEPSFLTPIGKASANTGNVILFNPLVDDSFDLSVDEEYSYSPGQSRGLLFNNENPNSLFYGLLDANVRFNLEYIFDINGSTYPVQQFEMFSGNWTGQSTDTVNVSLDDYSKYMMEIKPRKGMYLDLSVAEIVWRICDGIGFTKYQVERMDTEFPRHIPIFWIDGEKTVWEIFADLTEQTQVSIYFDGSGTLQVKTKEAAFDADRDGDSVWLTMGQHNTDTNDDPDYDDNNYDGAVPDIIELDKTNQFEANYVTIEYLETQFSEFNNGFPVMETVWEPGQTTDDSSRDDKRGNGTFDDSPDDSDTSSTLVLRATPVIKELLKDDNFVRIDPDQAKHWPYEGIVQIQGELIRYNGKQYVWYDNGNVKKVSVVKDSDQFKDIEDRSGPGSKHRNHWTGRLSVSQRGLWNTENKRHYTEANGYRVHSYRDGNKKENGKGWRHYKKNSVVQLRSPKNWGGKDWRFAFRGESTDAGFYNIGTMIRFPKDNGKHMMAGITIHQNGTEDNGYFIELRPTKKMTASVRKSTNELCFYSKKGLNTKRFGENKGKGAAVFIAPDTWYELDVEIQRDGADQTIRIFLNGQLAMQVQIDGGNEWHHPWTGKFGMFVRGHTKAQWEYLYAISRPQPLLSDNFSFMEKVDSSYVGRQWEREWVWRNRTDSRRTKKGWKREQERFSQMFYDEFGPYAHEVREFSVNFDPAPVLHSFLYVSNDWEAVCPEYRSHAFGADFILANASRKNAILHGTDPGIGGGNQSTFIYGRIVNVKEAETVIVQNEDQIRRRGKIEATITSPWIQSKSHALNIGEWIRDHWSQPADELTIEIFGNPLIEVTDVITVSYKLHDFNIGSHQYFVTSASNSFSDGGISTTLVVRRARKLT